MNNFNYNTNYTNKCNNSLINPNQNKNNTFYKQEKTSTIQVSIRIRPLLDHEDVYFWKSDLNSNSITTLNNNDYNYLLSTKDSLLSNKEKILKKVVLESVYSPQLYSFDKIYDKTSNTQIIYKETGRDIVKSLLAGFNGSILLYGQTTSGKTFTMLGSPENPGILPCTLRDIFNFIKKEKSDKNNENIIDSNKVYVSYIEIYNETIHDLLTNNSNLKLVENKKLGVVVQGAKRVRIKSFEDGINIKDYGEENRKYRETMINEYSSRSHSIFQITYESNFVDSNNIKYSKASYLNLVDLAGSERIHDYDSKSELFTETGYINKSLFVLSNVINKLADNKQVYIPYRDSKLTRLLSQTLGGNALSSIICTVSPAALNYYQTLSTLRFASRAKTIQVKAQALFKVDENNEIDFYKMEIKRLKKEIEDRNFASTINMSSSKFISEDEYKEVLKSNEQLLQDLEQYKNLYQKEKNKNEALEQLKSNKSRTNNNIVDNNTNSISYFSGEDNTNKDNMSVDSRKYIGKDEISYLENIVNKMNQSDLKDSTNNKTYKNKNNTNLSINKTNKDVSILKSEYLDKKIDINTSFNNNKSANLNNEKNNVKKQGNFKEKLGLYISNNSDVLNTNFKVMSFNNKSKSQPKFGVKTNVHNLSSSNIIIDSTTNNGNNINNNNNNNKQLLYNKSESYNNKYSDNELHASNGFPSKSKNNFNDTLLNNNKHFQEEKLELDSINQFKNFKLNFSIDKSSNIDINIKNLKKKYNNMLLLLENTLEDKKQYLENYYRKLIKETLALYSNDKSNLEGNLPIINITKQHSSKLKELREIFDNKLKDIEKEFYGYLKLITVYSSSSNNNNN